MERKIFTVAELTRKIKTALESDFTYVLIQGELSNFKRHSSGHCYFCLKDGSAQISAVMWRSRAQNLLFTPLDGMNVIVSGRITVYEPRGVYQVEANTLKPLGAGELQLAFEELKLRLADEGLFDTAHKKRLPQFPGKIGIVTSPTGAAIKDILHILRRRFPVVEVVINPVKVQGSGAATEIAHAVDDFNRLGGIDVIIVARGGGSIEDLWAFNEEEVARAIYRSRIPVISAVGHEIDFTIADFVADLRAPTPSAAAELVVPDRNTVLDIVRDNWYTIHQIMHKTLGYQKESIKNLIQSYSFNKPFDLLRQANQQVDELEKGLFVSVTHRLSMLTTVSESLDRRLASLAPDQVLKRGYAIVRKDTEVVDSCKKVDAEDTIDIRFHDGSVSSRIL